MKGPRGGGKSQFLGSLAFALWYLRGLKGVDIGGSMNQAKLVYNYLLHIINGSEHIRDSLEHEPLMERTIGPNGNYFACLPASPKAVRGPHPDVLMIDEACETSDEIVDSALPMVDTSPNPLRIVTSTFHKVFGIFQEIWDAAPELGYHRVSWDVFDVCKVFDPKVWRDPTLNREIKDLDELEKLAKGRTGDTEGWIPVMNIINAWRQKRSLEWFLIEYMGNRPNITGLVNDPVDVDACTFDQATTNRYNYVKDAECVIGIDWGFSNMTAVVDLMNYVNGIKVQIENKNYVQTDVEVIIDDVVAMVKARRHGLIYADSSGKFENNLLQKRLAQANLVRSCRVIEVVFSKDKEEMVGNYRAHFQRRLMRIPSRHKDAIRQHKRYHYVEGTNKPAKEDDHIPDATMCALQHWKLGSESAGGGIIETDRSANRAIAAGLMNKRF